jgi:hypothetical protein
MVLRSWSESAGSVMASLYYHVLGKTQMQTLSKYHKFITRTGAGITTGQGQSEVSNPDQSQKVQDGRQAQGQGRQNVQNRDN